MTTDHQPSSSATLPALYVSHGAPLFALEPGSTGPALTRWGAELRARQPGLRGVVIMSPHWMAQGATVMTGVRPATWHDFGGFAPALYQLQYPAAGDPALAGQVLDLLRQAGIAARGDAARSFDHGAWVPLMHLFPQADVPVVQLALPVGAGPAEVHAMGAALRGLRAQGVLLVGSGSMTHNLAEFFGGGMSPPPMCWSSAAGSSSRSSAATWRRCWTTAPARPMQGAPTRPRSISCRCSLRWARRARASRYGI